MHVEIIPCLQDNYAYLLHCEKTGETAIVDPSESRPVLERLQSLGLQLSAIFNTHHHWDHTGGNQGLLEKWPNLRVYGYSSDRGRIFGQTHFLAANQEIQLGALVAHILYNPGHTLGAISYWFPNEKAIFTGDTLFAAGCGRVFEGTMAQMYVSLNQVLGQIPGKTQIYFGHEYTCKNLAFAQEVEPQNPEIQARLTFCQSQRDQGKFTTPAMMQDELNTNPFLRCHEKELIHWAQTLEPGQISDASDVFRVLRKMKDRF